jgi:hypothetical protein
MDNALEGLFGSSDEDKVLGTERARDFVRRYSEGPKDQGYEAQEAAGQLNQVLPRASSDQVERATRRALADLPEDQRAEFGDFVKQLRERDAGSRAGGGYSVDDLAGMFGQAGGSANSIDDLFGGILGGDGRSRAGGDVGSLLGGLFGGGDTNRRPSSSEGGGLGGFLSSGVGKIVLGGIAAYLTKEMLEGRQ